MHPPCVLSTTACKIFTKILLLRLRPKFPEPMFGQLCGMQNSQTLDGSLAAQQLVHLSYAYGLPLVLIKLDIKAAFDCLLHTAVARFLICIEACREAELPLEIITNSKVESSMGPATWKQGLHKGLVQSSAYSAQIFARVLDHFLGPIWER